MAAQTTIGKLLVELFLKDEQFQKGLKGAQAALKNTGKSVTSLAGNVQKKLTVAFKMLNVTILGVLGASTALGSAFEKQMSAVAAVRGIVRGQGDDYDLLANKARQLGATTAFSATQAAQGMEALARAGLSTNEIIAASNTALKLAGAGQIGLARSAEILASSMAQFGLEADDAARISDVMTVATQNTLFATEDLAQAMKFAGTAGAAFGMDIETTTAAVAQFRNLGLEGSMAGVQFRQTMAAVAAPTKTAAGALEKYGLTLADVNPETKSFRDIMITIGDAGVTAGDAMKIFGSRVGGNVAKVARNMSQSADEFDNLVGALEDSAGATEKAYGTMTDNVVGRFNQIKSAMEESLIGLFETFRGPLTELLDSMVGFLRAFQSEFAIQSDTISGNFQSLIGEVTSFIRNNTAEGAKNLAQFIVALQQVAQNMVPILQMIGRLAVMLSSLAPLLDEIVLLFSAIWAVQKVVAFVNVVLSVISAVKAATVAVSAFAAAVNLSTGGLVALAAVITTVVIGIGIWIKRTIQARNETDRLREANEALARQAQKGREQIDGALAFKLAATKKELQAEKDRLRAAGELDNATRKQIDSMLRLTDAEAARMFRTGQLINMGDKLITVEQALAKGGTEGRARVEQRTVALRQQIEKLTEKMGTATGEAQRLFQQELTEAQTSLVSLQNALDGVTDGTEGVGNVALAGADALAQLRGEMDEAGDSADDLSKKEKKVSDATADMADRLRAELSGVGLDGLEALRNSGAQRKAEIKRQFAEQIAEEKAQGARLEALRERQRVALGLVDQIVEKQISDEVARERENAEKRTGDLLAQIRRQSATKLERIEMDRLAALKQAETASGSEIAEINAFFDEKKREAAEEGEEDQKSIIERLTGFSVGRIKAFGQEFVTAWKDLGAASGKVLGPINQKALKPIGDRVSGIADAVGGKLTAAWNAFGDAAANKTGVLGQVLGRVGSEVGGFVGGMGRLASGIVAGFGQATVAVVDFGVKSVKAFQSAAQGAASLGKKMTGFGGQLGDLMPSMNDLLGGFSFNVTDVVGDLIAAEDAAATAVADAEAALASAQESGDPEAIKAAQEQLDAAKQQQSDASPAGMVQNMVDQAVRFAETFAEQAPSIMQSLTEQIPVLVEALTTAFPLVVDAVVENLPLVLGAVIEAIPSIIDTLVTEIPRLLQVVLDLLPTVITEAANAIARLITELVPVLVEQIFAALPSIITALLGALVTIIDALVAALPQVIAAIVNAIPFILTAIIEAIPTLLESIIRAVPILLTALVEAIPVLIDAILGAVPLLITTVIGAIPMLLSALIELLPDLISALILLIPELVMALIVALPEIAMALVQAIVMELLPALPLIVFELMKAIVEGMGDAIQKIAQALGEAIADFFGLFKKKGGSKKGAFSGIDYVPATMRMTVHKGERIVPADRNVQPDTGGPAPAGAAAEHGMGVSGGGGGGGTVDIAVIAEGRMLDAVQVQASARGHANGVTKQIRRASGVKIGLSKGRFNAFS